MDFGSYEEFQEFKIVNFKYNEEFSFRKKKKKSVIYQGCLPASCLYKFKFKIKFKIWKFMLGAPIDMFSIDIIITCMGNLILTFIYY